MNGRRLLYGTGAIAALALAAPCVISAQDSAAEVEVRSAAPLSEYIWEALSTPDVLTAEPPAPTHAGLSALARTTVSDFAALPRRTSTWVILGIGGGLALLAHPIDHNVNSHVVGSRAVGRFFAPGKVIGSSWAQAGTSIGLYVVGRYVIPHEGEPKTNTIAHLGYDLLRAQVVSQALVQSVKLAVRRDRPTGECCSFPSGHAASAFALASVLERHFGYRAAWPT